MKILSFFLALFFNLSLFACQLIPGSYVSLSGPISHLWQEWGLLQDPSWKAASSYHFLPSNFKGEVLAGGLLLTKNKLLKYKDAVVFYDQSSQLDRLLKKYSYKNKVSINTRKLGVFETLDQLIKSSLPYLHECEKEISKIQQLKVKIQKKMLNIKTTGKLIFYLGALSKNGKSPEFIMANDSFIIDLKQAAALRTYPSDLAYVRWSQKEITNQKGFIHIGLEVDKNCPGICLQQVEKDRYNLSGARILTPGISQVSVLEKLLDKFY